MSVFSSLKFQYEFLKHQQIILQKFEEKIKRNKSKTFRFHLVAPPGSGKTIIGMEMARRLAAPTLIICPNTTIQGQWVEKFRMFLPKGSQDELVKEINTTTDDLKSCNVFTYQMLSVPCGDDEALLRMSENLWAETVSKSQAVSIEEALLRILRMKETNPSAYREEISKFSKKLRQSYLNEAECDLSKVLHPNTTKLIKKIVKCNIKTVVFDECHHLQSYWALVMKEIITEIGALSIIGLTATPPADAEKEKLEYYTDLLGEIDYQIPTPAVIKEGMLAPFQDLVYFCLPAEKELEYINNCHQKFKLLVDEFSQQNSGFYFWVILRIVDRKLVSGETQDWTKFINSKPNLAAAGVKFLLHNEYKIPWDITITDDMYQQMSLEDWVCLIEDYALNHLKLSSDQKDKDLLTDIKDALRSLGFLLTEQGIRAHSSPLDRVLAYSRSKLEAVKEILSVEIEELGDRIRAAIITDFEVSNALSLKKVESIIDDECGGAVSVMKILTKDPVTDRLDPVMVTGKNLICDDDLAEKYVRLGLEWAKSQGYSIDLSIKTVESDRFVSIEGSGSDWSTKTAVLMTTCLFEQGVTKCIIGTRGLFSEGWDSLNLNTLIDLSVVTTFATVNQLRGRSIRKSPEDPEKISNNWDVICMAPGMEKGYNDLNRLYRKHNQFYGICDDGEIQMGINHIDPSLSLCDRELTAQDMKSINEKMLCAARNRNKAYELWKIGEPFDNIELVCSEIKLLKPIKMKAGSLITDEKRALKNKIKANLIKLMGTVLSATAASTAAVTILPASVPLFGVSAFMGFKLYEGVIDMWTYGKDNFFQLSVKSSVKDIARCTLNALIECGFISSKATEDSIIVTERSDGTIRVYLDSGDEDSDIFSTAIYRVFSPIEDQRYAIQRFEVFVPEKNLARFAYILRFGIDKYPPMLACYHPLPDVFSTKEKALVFKKYWNKFVSPGDIVFLKGQKGLEIVEKFGRINSLGARKITMKIWK